MSVLVVDDEPQVLRAIEDTLEDQFEVFAETSPEAATRLLKTLPELSVILSDQRMPAMSGDQFLEQAQELSDATRLLITGYADLEAVIRAVNLGRIFGYVSKPWNPDHLKLVVLKAAEHYRLLKDLKSERDLLHNLMDSIPDAIFFKNREHRLIRLNRAHGARLGVARPEDAIGRQDWELLPFDEVLESEAEEKEVFRSGVPSSDRVHRIVAGADEDRWVSTTKAPIRDDRGQVTGLVGIARDITDRKRAEEALRESEAALHRAQLVARLSHVITGPEGRFETWSDTLPQLIGVDSARMPASTREWLDLLHPEDRVTFRAKAIAAGVTGERTEVEYRLRRSDAAWINVYHVMEPLAGRTIQAGRQRWFNTLQDVTEQKRVLEALQASEERHRAMFENAGVSITYSDLDGRFLMVNPKFSEMTGYTRDEARSHGFRDLTHPDDLQRGVDLRAQLIAGTAPLYERELRLVRKDGTELWANVTTSLIRGAGGRPAHFISVLNDVSERKTAQEKIKRLNRVYAVLSGINALIVRVRDRDELFREACRIAVDAGQFSLAWIGVVDREAMQVMPVAWHGAERGLLDLIRDRLSLRGEASAADSIIVRAVRTQQAVVSNDLLGDPRIRFGKEYAERGFRSAVALPLIASEKVAGILALYVNETGFFDDQEMKLLTELAGDIAFALEHIEKSEKVDYLAYYDVLTGLANRTLFQERLTQQLHAAAAGQHKVAVLLVDVERFKSVNDSLGRQAGDLLLKRVAERLRRQAPDPDEIARVGTDQFAIVLADVKQEEEVARFIEQGAQECFGAPFELTGTKLKVRAKVGIAMYPDDGTDADTLIRNAEAALDKAKSGGHPYLFFATEMAQRVAGKLALENQLQQALEKDEFVLHYQPKVELETRRIVGAEALIRWQKPEHGLVPPGEFISLMEETGLILEVGAWALAKAAADHLRWLEQGLAAPRVAVNVSAIQLRRREFVSTVQQAMRRGATPPGIDLEITESLVMEDIESNIQKLKAVRGLGVGIAIDDFGTGYSSLGYLAKLPVQSLKIDRSFIVSMASDPNAMTLVSTIISLAHSLGLTVIAEGVDTEEQARMLRLLRCQQMQGFLFCKPLPLEEMTDLLKQQKRA